MSNWIYGKDLIEHWDIEDFELFGFLKKGLQPYNKLGRKVIGSDSLEWDRKWTLEYCENLVRGTEEAGMVMTNSGPNVSRLTEQEIKQKGKKLYESQTPPNSPYISFSLPSNTKKATKAIESVKSFRFKKDEASEFAEKHGLHKLDKGRSYHTSAEEPNKKEAVETSPEKPIEADKSEPQDLASLRSSPHADGIAKPLTARDILTGGKKDVTARDILTEDIDLSENIKRFEENPLDAENNAEYLDKFIKKATLPRRRALTTEKLTRERASVFEEKPIETGKKAPTASKQMERLPVADINKRIGNVEKTQKEVLQEFDAIIEAFTIIPESDYEIKIKKSGKAPISYPHHILNFKTKKTLWKTFLEIIRDNGFYNVGPSGSQDVDVKNEYDKKQKRLREINKKLIMFFREKFSSQIPDNYNFFAPYPDEGKKGVYKLQIPIKTHTKNDSRYRHKTKEELLDLLSQTFNEYARTPQNYLKEKIDALRLELIENHGMTEKEIRDYVYPKTDKEVIEKEFSNYVYESPKDTESD